MELMEKDTVVFGITTCCQGRTYLNRPPQLPPIRPIAIAIHPIHSLHGHHPLTSAIFSFRLSRAGR
jgi:hypothetical protein